jgi:hypothetical protein
MYLYAKIKKKTLKYFWNKHKLNKNIFKQGSFWCSRRSSQQINVLPNIKSVRLCYVILMIAVFDRPNRLSDYVKLTNLT